MGETDSGVRLRQAVLLAADLEPVVAELRAELGLGEPYADPGVAEFGLRNAVCALGDGFIEVVSPARAGTAAGRHLERRGRDGGYMAMFQLDDLEAARARVRELDVRVVWQIDLPDISGTHLHPADVGGTIISLDRPDPRGSWRWGGPDWTGRAGRGAPGALVGLNVSVADPGAVAARWAHVLSVSVAGGERPLLRLDGGTHVTFLPARSAREEGLTGIVVAVPPDLRRGRESLAIGDVRFELRDAP